MHAASTKGNWTTKTNFLALKETTVLATLDHDKGLQLVSIVTQTVPLGEMAQ